ncbi:MAG: Ig-like domain-containing protein [Acidobacteriota bacterium]
MSFRTLARRISFFLTASIFALAALPAAAGTICLAWDPVPDTDVAGYRIEWGQATGVYTQQVDVALTPQVTLTGLADCTTWFVAVKAVDTAGNFSVNFSNEIAGWPRPVIGGISPSSVEQGRQLDLVITGVNFQNGMTLVFDNPGITVQSVTPSCTQVVAHVTVADTAPVGIGGFQVVNPDQSSGAGAGLLTIEPATQPTVVAAAPADGSTGVAGNAQPTLTFSEPIEPLTVSPASIRILDASGASVPQAASSPQLSTDGLTVTLTPAAPLTAGAFYRISAVGGTTSVTDLAGHHLANTFTQATGFQVQDSTAPVLTSVAAGSVTSTTARIVWSSSEPADGQVFYRPSGRVFYQQSPLDPGMATSHSILLQGLIPATTYEFHVTSRDGAGNATTTTPDQTFTTPSSTDLFLEFEAESGRLAAPVAAASGPGAFNQGFIMTPAGTPQGTATGPAGTADYGFNLPADGTWHLWVRLLSKGSGGSAWFEDVDGAGRQPVSTVAAGEWVWVAGRSYTLAAGLHTLQLGGGEAEARVDRVLLTTDAAFVPTEQAGGDTSSPAAVTGAAAVGTDRTALLSWTNPVDPDLARIIVRYRTDGVSPVSPVDGFPLADRPASPLASETATHSGLANGTTYSYSIFALDSAGNVSAAARVQATPFDDQPPAQVLNLRRTDAVGGP